MSTVRWLGLAVAMVLVLAHPALSGEPAAAPDPIAMVRALRAIQDEVGAGNSAAHAEQKRLAAEMAERLIAAPVAMWESAPNVKAMLTYTLSGGEPRVLQHIMASGSPPGLSEELVTLIKGVLAYTTGQWSEAEALLSAFDPRALEIDIAAPMALIRGVLAAKGNPSKALSLLDEARLLAPGTLIEEAALRRQVLLLAEARSHDRFELLAKQYFRRFGRSLYAEAFQRQLAVSLISEPFDSERGEQTMRIVSMLGRDVQRDVYLLMARESIRRGAVGAARFAAARALVVSAGESTEGERSRLYEGSALIVTEDFEAGLQTLMGITRARLGADDRELLDKAHRVAAEVRRWPSVSPEAAAGGAAGSAEEVTATSPSVERARASIERTDAFLQAVRR